MNYGNESLGAYSGGDVPQMKMASAPTLQQRLDSAVDSAKRQLADAEEARDILKRNPDLERLLNLMQKGRF